MKAREKPKTEKHSIELMKESDIDSVLNIQIETNLSRWKREDYQNEISREDSISLIVKSFDEKTIGFGVVRLIAEKKEAFDTAEILNIAVLNSKQNFGIGQKLFENIKTELIDKNISDIWLEVRTSNSKAIGFYQKNGFVQQFVRKKYYINPIEDAQIFKLSINYEISN